MNQILEICHCGNDRASHFEGKHACLALACDCTSYVDRWDPKPPPTKRSAEPGNSGWVDHFRPGGVP